jgi:hypothetical protein
MMKKEDRNILIIITLIILSWGFLYCQIDALREDIKYMNVASQ